jgi:hypothetical protein
VTKFSGVPAYYPFHDRSLLDAPGRPAADNLVYAAKRRGLPIGGSPLHTYGRQLRRELTCASKRPLVARTSGAC